MAIDAEHMSARCADGRRLDPHTALNSAWLARISPSPSVERAPLPPRDRVVAAVNAFLGKQPPSTRRRLYSFEELVRGTGTCGQLLGPVLSDLGWERVRRWRGNRGTRQANYFRYWQPPR